VALAVQPALSIRCHPQALPAQSVPQGLPVQPRLRDRMDLPVLLALAVLADLQLPFPFRPMPEFPAL